MVDRQAWVQPGGAEWQGMDKGNDKTPSREGTD